MMQQPECGGGKEYSVVAADGTSLVTHIFDTRELMGKCAADVAAEKINQLLQQKHEVNIIFAAAPSQNEFLAALIQKDIDWARVNAFHMDEYIGLPPNDQRMFAPFLNEKIFSLLPFKTVNLINGAAADPQQECIRYAELLAKLPADIVCMGIGENGHIAFNDPHVADFNDPLSVKIVDLDEACRQQQVNDVCFNTIDEVPTHAITLTIPALMAAANIFCMVPGIKKAKAVYHTLTTAITEQHPATILRKHSCAILFLDKESGALLNL